MKRLIIYDPRDGQIIQITTPAPVGDIPKGLIPEGLSAIRTTKDVSGKTHKVRRGKIVPKSSRVQESENLEWAWRDLRFRREQRLAESDWTQVPDAPVDREAWRAYRQALRDLPDNTADPRNVKWPEPPK